MKTPAIVLRSFIQGESDLILSFMTRDHGKVRAIAKGAMRSQKRFMGQFLLFQHLELSLVQPKQTEESLAAPRAERFGRQTGPVIGKDHSIRFLERLGNRLEIPAGEQWIELPHNDPQDFLLRRLPVK